MEPDEVVPESYDDDEMVGNDADSGSTSSPTTIKQPFSPQQRSSDSEEWAPSEPGRQSPFGSLSGGVAEFHRRQYLKCVDPPNSAPSLHRNRHVYPMSASLTHIKRKASLTPLSVVRASPLRTSPSSEDVELLSGATSGSSQSQQIVTSSTASPSPTSRTLDSDLASQSISQSTPVVRRRARAQTFTMASVSQFNAAQNNLSPLKITKRQLPAAGGSPLPLKHHSQRPRAIVIPVGADVAITRTNSNTFTHSHTMSELSPTGSSPRSPLNIKSHHQSFLQNATSPQNQSFHDDQYSFAKKRKQFSSIDHLQKRGRSNSICVGASNEPSNAISQSMPHKLSPLYHPLHHKEVKTTKHVSKGYDEHGRKTINQYSFMHQIGSGVSSKVKLCINWESGEECAIKVINRSLMKSVNHGLRRVSHQGITYESIRREIAILKKVRHPNIVRVIEVIDDPTADKMYIVLEHVQGGELLKLDADGNVIPKVHTSPQTFIAAPHSYSEGSSSLRHNYESPPATFDHPLRKPSTDALDDILDEAFPHQSPGSYSSSPLTSDFSSPIRVRSRSEAPQYTTPRDMNFPPTSPSGVQTVSSSLKIPRLAPLKIPKTPDHDSSEGGKFAPPTENPNLSSSTFSHQSSQQRKTPTAENIINADGTIPEHIARSYFRDLISALHYLHKNNIVHRDIKPENMLIESSTNTLKLSDFGVSQFTDGEDDYFEDTTGTPAFYPPESCKVGRTYGRAADVWACGITLFIMLFGRLPFKPQSGHPGAKLYSLFTSIEKEGITLPPDTEEDLRNLFARVLDKNPDTRITTEELLHHPWLLTDSTLDDDDDVDVAVNEEDLSKAITIQNHFKILDRVFYKIKDNWKKLRTPRSPLSTLRTVNILKPLTGSPTSSSPPRTPTSSSPAESSSFSSQRGLFSKPKTRNRSQSVSAAQHHAVSLPVPIRMTERR